MALTLAASKMGSHTYADRLDFVLPDFTRLAWVSDPAREVWEPRLQRIIEAWMQIEWLSSAAGVRACGIVMATPEQFLKQAPIWAEHALSPMPLQMLGISRQSYSATTVAVVPGEPFAFRFVLGSPSDVASFKRAWDAADQREIGQLLGYPSCCRDFFRNVWVEQNMVDTTWPMACNTVAAVAGTPSILELSGPPECNILWRWMGARAVPHLPCKFDCQATVELARRLTRVGRDNGFEQEMDWLLDVLSWPVEWSALHGIAEIRTPVLKVSTRTDATAGKYVVRSRGAAYPDEGARGLDFPYRQFEGTPLTASQAYRRGMSEPLPVLNGPPDWYATDNGFPDLAALARAHTPIVELARAALEEAEGEIDILDLGCGNGALLKAIQESCPSVTPYGIEIEPERVAHARALQPRFAANFIQGDLLESDDLWPADRRYALVLLMPGRLLESSPSRAARLRARLKERCDRILLYAYGGGSGESGNHLAQLSQAAGFTLTQANLEASIGLATVNHAAVPGSPVTLVSQAGGSEDRPGAASPALPGGLCRSSAVVEEELGDELLLYCPERGTLFALNSSARAIWWLIDGKRNTEDIARELARQLGCSADDMLLDVELAVRRLGELSVLQSA